MTRRDGSKVEFRFVNQDGVWYWDILWKVRGGVMPGGQPSIPLPDVELKGCNSLKECFDAISKKRGEQWVGKIFADAMQPQGK